MEERNKHKDQSYKVFCPLPWELEALTREGRAESVLGGETSQEVTLTLGLERQRARQTRRWVYGGEESKQVEFGAFMLPKCWLEPDELERGMKQDGRGLQEIGEVGQ